MAGHKSSEAMESGDLPEGAREGWSGEEGTRLHYVEAGRGPAVILLHGFPQYWYSWRHQIVTLAAAGYRVIAPDLRGYNLFGQTEGDRELPSRSARRGYRNADPKPTSIATAGLWRVRAH